MVKLAYDMTAPHQINTEIYKYLKVYKHTRHSTKFAYVRYKVKVCFLHACIRFLFSFFLSILLFMTLISKKKERERVYRHM